MKIVADQEIPLINHYFSKVGDIVLKPGREISAEDVKDAEILLVRSVTKVNEALLKNSTLKFVGSVTTGEDHLDINWLNKAGIRWSSAKGCNAIAVAEYVACVVAALKKMNFLMEEKLCAAVVGVGEIGQKVVVLLKTLGFEVIQCDPLRAEQEKDFPHVPLENLENLDLISLHTPLTKEGEYPTYHFIQKEFLQRQKKGCVLLNTGRGEVIDSNELKCFGQHLLWAFDVWEEEPFIDLEIVLPAIIATPHIAGYTVESKLRGIEMIYNAFVGKQNSSLLKELGKEKIVTSNQLIDWREVLLTVFNPLSMSEKMKNSLVTDPKNFDLLRKNFNKRHEFNSIDISQLELPEKDNNLLERLGFYFSLKK